MEFDLEGIEHQAPSGALVPIGGKLPFYKEIRTSGLLNFLITIYPDEDKKKINKWLYIRTKPGFYIEFKPSLHLAYAHQKDGHGTQHWWRLFFDEQWQDMIEQIFKGTALVVGKTAGNSHKGTTEWGGMYFRSPAEIKIAEALDKRGVMFFGNARGRIGSQGSPVSVSELTGRLEVDFLVFHKGKCMSLEMDGKHHEEGGQAHRDYIRVGYC